MLTVHGKERSLAEVSLCFLFAMPLWLLDGFTLSTLWNWFVVPSFGLDTMHYAQACGLSCIVALLKPFNTKNIEKNLVVEIVSNALARAVLLPYGWVVLQIWR